MLQHVQESATAQTNTAAALGKIIQGRQGISGSQQNGTSSSMPRSSNTSSNGSGHLQHGKMVSHHIQRSSGTSQQQSQHSSQV